MRPERFLILVCVAVLAVCGSAFASGFQGSAAHDGFVADSGLRPPLQRAWHRELGASAGFPVIAGGRVFVASRSDQSVIAFNPRTLKPVRRIPVGVNPYALTAAGGSIWVTAVGDNSLSRIDLR